VLRRRDAGGDASPRAGARGSSPRGASSWDDAGSPEGSEEMVEPVVEYSISPHAAFEEGGMKVTYDARTDTLTVILKEGVRVAESDEDKPGVILDYDDQGNLLSLEILDASRRVTDARKIEYQATE
jgi:uncharacterized protein YuzE